MKKILSFSLLTLLAIVMFSFQLAEPKKLNVGFTQDQWEKNISVLEYTKNALKQSNLPVNVVLPLTDSIAKFENDLIIQLQPQLAPDTKDTTTKKK